MILDGKKAATICILRILEEHTDKDHRLTQQGIIDKLKSKYGIVLERKAVASSLDILSDLGYEIDRNSNLGVCLMKHKFDTSEISYLIDAIFSSKALNAKEAHDLSNKVSTLVSEHDRKQYSFIYKSKDVNRREMNSEFFGVISTIEEAIKKHKNILFKVMTYDKNGKLILKNGGHELSMFPYYIINNFGKYYVLGINNYKKMMKFRIEFMYFPSLGDDDAPDKSEVDCLKTFDITKYMNTHIYMFDGDAERITLLIERDSMIREVKDWFGKDVRIYTKDEKIYADINACQKDVEFWLLQYCEDIKVVSPKSLQDNVKMKLQRNLEKYNNLEAVGSKTRIELNKILENVMTSIDKYKDVFDADEKDFTHKFKEHLEKYISSDHKIEIKGNNLEVAIDDDSDKALVVLKLKKNDATDDDFFDLLKGIEKAQTEKTNYAETYAVSLVHGISYYKVKYKTPEAEYFDYKNTKEIVKPIKHGKETFNPLSPVKIRWSSPTDNKMLKFYIIKG